MWDRNILLWNAFEQAPHAMALLGEKGPFSATSLKNKLPREEKVEEATVE